MDRKLHGLLVEAYRCSDAREGAESQFQAADPVALAGLVAAEDAAWLAVESYWVRQDGATV